LQSKSSNALWLCTYIFTYVHFFYQLSLRFSLFLILSLFILCIFILYFCEERTSHSLTPPPPFVCCILSDDHLCGSHSKMSSSNTMRVIREIGLIPLCSAGMQKNRNTLEISWRGTK
jgi:hypothetical protein